jgi:hypothetical protein
MYSMCCAVDGLKSWFKTLEQEELAVAMTMPLILAGAVVVSSRWGSWSFAAA